MTLSARDIICGFRALVKVADLKCTEIRDEDYDETSEIEIKGPDNTFIMKEYSPNVFAAIRKANNISTDFFLESFHIPEEAEVTGSTGRSGSLFYETPDGNFFYKTLLHPEVGTMKLMLKHYLEHLNVHKNTFIMKMYGLFRCSLPTEKTWILIMGSVFPKGVKIHEKYDLKGRKAKPGKSHADRGVISQKVLKDNEINRRLYFENDDDKEFFMKQLDTDVELLKNNNVMDYSLLIGIHKPDKKDDEPEIKKRPSNLKKKDSERNNNNEPDNKRRASNLKKKDTETKKEKRPSNLKKKDTEKIDTIDEEDENKKEKRPSKIKKNDTEKDSKSNKKTDKEDLKSKRSSKNLKKASSKSDDNGKEIENEKVKESKKKTKSEENNQKISKKKSNNSLEEDNGHESDKKKIESSNEDKKNETDDKINLKKSSNSDEDKNSGEEKKIKNSKKNKSDDENPDIEITKEENGKSKRKKKKGTNGHKSVMIDEDRYKGFKGYNPHEQEKEIYYIGIIDCLTEYLLGKKLANLFKKFIWEQETLSTVKAKLYAERFGKFMKEDLIFDPDRHNIDTPIKMETESESSDEKRRSATQSARTDRRKNRSTMTIAHEEDDTKKKKT